MAFPRNTVMKFIEVKLSKEERLAMGQEQASATMEIADIEAEVKEINKRKAPLKNRIKVLARAIDTGIEERDVECEWIYNWEKGTKQAKRMDNHQFTGGACPIEAHERQEELT
jgi:hypothetical protein